LDRSLRHSFANTNRGFDILNKVLLSY